MGGGRAGAPPRPRRDTPAATNKTKGDDARTHHHHRLLLLYAQTLWFALCGPSRAQGRMLWALAQNYHVDLQWGGAPREAPAERARRRKRGCRAGAPAPTDIPRPYTGIGAPFVHRARVLTSLHLQSSTSSHLTCRVVSISSDVPFWAKLFDQLERLPKFCRTTLLPVKPCERRASHILSEWCKTLEESSGSSTSSAKLDRALKEPTRQLLRLASLA